MREVSIRKKMNIYGKEVIKIEINLKLNFDHYILLDSLNDKTNY